MENINIKIKKSVFNPVYLPFLENEDRYLTFYGGGSSGKSYFIAQRWIYLILKIKMNLLVVRQTGKSNRDSTFALLVQIIREWNLSQYFYINKSNLRIKCVNGNEIIFIGLDDVEKIKSTTFENGELTHEWIEEATECQEEDINQLKIRMRGGTSKKQMVLSFNPINISHWIKRHFIDSGLATVVHTTYKDNKFLTDDDREVLESFKETDPYYYQVYGLGQWGILGKTYFNARNIQERINHLREPIKVGFFSYIYENEQIKDYRWQDDPNGFIKIYKDKQDRTPYVLGGDTSGEGSDYFTGHVLDNTTGEQVAVLRQEFNEVEYTRQMVCLGLYYNEALLGIEANFSTYPIQEAERLRYTKQYVREEEDTFTGRVAKKFGFKTTSVSRPRILAGLQTIVLESVNLINDKDTLEEMLVFVRNEKGRPEAKEGEHDDLVMGLAIAYDIREQQSFKVEQRRYTESYGGLNVNSDFGARIEII